nr:unnamed protein product [Callosobruchus chinensis]
MACLGINKEKATQIALNELGRSEKDLQAEVDALKEWFKTQKHLPEVPNDHILKNHILSNKFHMEKTKKKIEMALFPLGTTEAGHSVTVIWMNMNKNEQTPDPYDVLSHALNSIEVIGLETVVLPGIVIHDYQSITLDYVTKITPVTIRKSMLAIGNMFNIRFRQIHLVNVPAYAEMMINMYKQIIIHSTVEGLQKYLPKSILPKDYGGDLPSLSMLADQWNKNFEKYADRFDKLDEMKIDETLRSTPLEDDELLGIYGHFRKLDID